MEPREVVWLRRTRDLSQRLGSEEDLAKLPPLILDAALELTGAERAFLIQVVGPDVQGGYRLDVLATRGFVGNALEGPAGHVPRTVVERALADGGKPVITSRPADAGLIEVSSVAGRGILSLVCVPLKVRGRTTGVLYLDDRSQETLFREEDLATLQTFATQAALSLELAGEETPAAREATFVVGASPQITTLLAEIERVSRSSDPVLICGEPGTEGALVAREVHAQGAQRDLPFRTIACGGSAQEQAQRLLGTASKPGPLARDGSVCLEEVEALDPELQRILARALREGGYTLPGSETRAPLRARLLVLTSVDLAERTYAGLFRSDLYYRLDVQRLVVPPLRQRREDVPALIDALLGRLGLPALTIGDEALKRMVQYGWPGNLLELEGELRRLAQLGTPRVAFLDLSDRVRAGHGVVHERPDFSGKTLGELEEELVRGAMRDCDGVKARAARQLGIPRSTLYHLLERYLIT